MPASISNPASESAYELLGRALVLWNRIEGLWYLLFVTMLDAPRDQADAIYRRLANFTPQRDLGRALAEVVLKDHDDARNKVLAAEAAIREQVGRRNAFVH